MCLSYYYETTLCTFMIAFLFCPCNGNCTTITRSSIPLDASINCDFNLHGFSKTSTPFDLGHLWCMHCQLMCLHLLQNVPTSCCVSSTTEAPKAHMPFLNGFLDCISSRMHVPPMLKRSSFLSHFGNKLQKEC